MIEHPRAIRLSVPDLALARSWYAQALQTEPVHESERSVSFIVGFCTLTLTLGPAGATNNGPAGSATSIYWGVDDVQGHFQRISALPQTGQVQTTRLNVAPGTAEVLDPFGNVFGLTFSETQADRVARQQREARLAALQNVRQTVDQFQALEDKENKTSRKVFTWAFAALAVLVVLVWGAVQFRTPTKPVDARTTLGVPAK